VVFVVPSSGLLARLRPVLRSTTPLGGTEQIGISVPELGGRGKGGVATGEPLDAAGEARLGCNVTHLVGLGYGEVAVQLAGEVEREASFVLPPN
jgi:hypothetical protein